MTRPMLVSLALLTGCGAAAGDGGPAAFRTFNPGKAPVEIAQGERLFNTYCASCHGYYGRGEGLGPALLDTLYLSPRLSDAAIELAVLQGVPQTHWRYGAMPKVGPMGPAEARLVTLYVRWLQQRAAADPNIRKFGS